MLLRRIKQIAPWLVAAALVGYLLWRTSARELAAALSAAHLGYLMLTVLYLVGASLLADSWAMSRVLSRHLTPVGWGELLPVRAATYLLAILNYHLGQAGVIYYVHRTRRVSLAAVTGLVMMMMGTVLLILGAIAALGLVLAADPYTRRFGWLLALMGGATLAYFVVLHVRPGWLARRQLLTPLFDAGFTGHMGATLVRVPHVLVTVSTHLLAMRCFEIEVPLGAALVQIPLMLLVAGLPVTPFGLGTIQLAAVHFFARYLPCPTPAARARVLAYSLSLSSLAFLVQAAVGLVCLRPVLRVLSEDS